MSDQNTPPEVSPTATATQNTTDHGQIPATANSPKVGISEKVRSAAARVISQAGFSFTKGRGRPKKCDQCAGVGCDSCGFTGKMPGKLDKPLADVAGEKIEIDFQPSPGGPAVAAAAPVDSSVAALFRRTCCQAVKGALGILKAVTATFATAAGIEAAFTAKTLAKAEPDPGAIDDFTESLDVVLKKHNIQPKNAEEWALAINFGRLVAPYALLIAEFKGEIRRQQNEQRQHWAREREKEQIRREAVSP